jgi:hypothetical protein
MTEFSNARIRSKRILDHLGYEFSESLPLLDNADMMRDRTTVTSRILGLHAAVALAYGYDERKGVIRSWLDSEHLSDHLTPVESEFVSGAVELFPIMQWRVEALFALAWACKITDLSLLDLVPDELVMWFPKISQLESPDNFRNRVELRTFADLVLELDLLYCLASAKTDIQLRGTIDRNPSSLDLRSVQQRRHALEWLLSDLDWEDISLDT